MSGFKITPNIIDVVIPEKKNNDYNIFIVTDYFG